MDNKKEQIDVGVLREPTVEFTYWRTENLQSHNKAMDSYGSILNGMRYINCLTNEGANVKFYIPLRFKLGIHKWRKSDDGIKIDFEAGISYPGYGSWSGEWGEINIQDDNPQNFKGTFSVYSKHFEDASPPRLDNGRFLLKLKVLG
ncbi:hypothetical protein BK668_25800 [Pseudomonas fluorescens]|nr:hypothetical protein BK668_25800 [Pseudomonas fluorescens]